MQSRVIPATCVYIEHAKCVSYNSADACGSCKQYDFLSSSYEDLIIHNYSEKGSVQFVFSRVSTSILLFSFCKHFALFFLSFCTRKVVRIKKRKLLKMDSRSLHGPKRLTSVFFVFFLFKKNLYSSSI